MDRRHLLAWPINALCLLLVCGLMPGLHLQGVSDAKDIAALLGLAGWLVCGALAWFDLPAEGLGFGIGCVVLNGVLFWIAVPVDGAACALAAAAVYGVASAIAARMVSDYC